MKKKKKIFNRFTALILIMLLIFSAIITRLISLQIVNVNEYIAKANTKSIRQIPEQAPRGKIIDSNGVVLATNKQSYTIVYMEPASAEKDFFTTFKKVFKYLGSSSKKNDKLLDELQLKVNPYRFEFTSSIKSVKRAQELQFKKDRGMQDIVEKKMFKGKTKEDTDLTDADKKKINKALLKITPEETFDYLIFKYDLYKLLGLSTAEEKQLVKDVNNNKISKHKIKEMLLKKYSVSELRKFMIVKDEIQLQSYSTYKPVTIASNVSKNMALLFEQVKSELPGIDVDLQPIRYYPKGSLGSNFIGYISKIPESSSSKYEEKGYDTSTDYIGMAGLESAFEDRLKGSKGGTTVRVNNDGRATEELFKLDPYPGENMVLTVKSELQKAAEDALQEEMKALQTNRHPEAGMDTGNATSGAAVVIDVKTGGVLAMASLPKYNPNLFSIPGKLTAKKSKALFSPDYKSFAKKYIARMNLSVSPNYLFDFKTDRDKYNVYPKPFINYATTATPCGSTFKPLTAIAALQTGVLKPDSLINDTGHYTVNGFDGHDSNRPRGLINLGTALEISCNYFFYELGNRLYNLGGLDELAKYAWKFGLGVNPKSNAQKSTGLEISEGFGNVYNDYTNRQLYSNTFKFNIASMLNSGSFSSNGFSVSFTPIDIADNASDKKAVADAKTALKARFKAAILGSYGNNQSEFFNKLEKDLTPLFKKLINVLPAEKRKEYQSDDAKKMAEALTYMTTYTFIPQIKTPGNVYNAAIGQGINQFTPVQLANYIATFANGGTRYKVHLVKEFKDASGKVIEKYKPVVEEKIKLKQSTIDAVKSGMERVTDEESGTAGEIFKNFAIQTAGKTGSATYMEKGKQEKVGRTSYAVYLGFAPINNPKIAVCVSIYNGGHGKFAAIVAKKIYEQYFHKLLKNDKAAKSK